jgi:hypothetical protein
MDQPELPREHTPQEIVDVDTIGNLDTARMALRWALERLHKETDQKHALEGRLKDAENALRKAVEEHGALQRTLSLRSGEADERELYYRRLEEFLSLRLEGKLDPAALAHKELEVDQLKRLLEQKMAQTEKDLAARRAALERETKLLREQTEAAARDRVRAVEQAAEVKSRALEQEHLAKMSELREKEILLRQEEKALSERQAHFEDYYAAQRAELQTQLKNYREEVEGQVRFRVNLAERALDERLAAMEAAWLREKALLTRELESWRLRMQELAPKLIELEKRRAAAEESATQAAVARDAAFVVSEERRKGFEQEKAMLAKERDALAGQRDEWKERAERHWHSAHELQKRLAQSEEQLQQLRAAAEREIAAIEQRKLDTQRHFEALEGEIGEWKKRHQESLARIFALENKLSAAEAALEQSRLQTTAQKDRFDAHRRAWDEAQKALQDELEHARRRVSEMTPRLLELERGLAAAEEAQAAEERQFVRFEDQKAAWEKERRLLAEDARVWREKAEAGLTRVLELERRLSAAEEAAVHVSAAGERQAARFDEQRKAWDAERAELEADLKAAAAPAPEGPKHSTESA